MSGVVLHSPKTCLSAYDPIADIAFPCFSINQF